MMSFVALISEAVQVCTSYALDKELGWRSFKLKTNILFAGVFHAEEKELADHISPRLPPWDSGAYDLLLATLLAW